MVAGVRGGCASDALSRHPTAHLTRVAKPIPLNGAGPKGPYGIRARATSSALSARTAMGYVAVPTEDDGPRSSPSRIPRRRSVGAWRSEAPQSRALNYSGGKLRQPAAPDRSRASLLIGWYKALGGALSGLHIFVWSDYI
jgi:hypothetical protein